MRVLITGGSGFIGSHLVEYHMNLGDEVLVVDDLSTGDLNNIAAFKNSPKFRFEEADILTWSGLAKAVDWSERIYHMAAVVGVFRVLKEPLRVIDVNIGGTERVLDLAAKSTAKPRILIASSSSVYGHSRRQQLSETNKLIMGNPTDALRNYAISKMTDEALALAYFVKMNLAVSIIRIFNTVGPRQTGQYGMVVPRFVQQACKNEPITIFGDGRQTRSFCDVRDLVRGLAMVAENKKTLGQVLNVGNDREIAINDLAKMICTLSNSNSSILHEDYEKAYGQKFEDIKNRRPSLKKFFRYTGFKHQWSLEETVKDLICSIRKDLP